LNPDVVILDLRMPGGSGLDLSAVLKEQRPALIVIVFTEKFAPDSVHLRRI